MAGIDPTLILAFQHRVDCDQCAVLKDADLDRMVLDLDNPAPCGVGNAVLIAAYRAMPSWLIRRSTVRTAS